MIDDYVCFEYSIALRKKIKAKKLIELVWYLQMMNSDGCGK